MPGTSRMCAHSLTALLYPQLMDFGAEIYRAFTD